MKRIAFGLVVLVLAGCGTAVEGAPGVSGQETVLATETTDAKSPAEPNTKPPPIVLVNAAGKQIARPGSSCVNYTDPVTGEGVGGCGDVGVDALRPGSLTVVHPGDTVLLLLAGAFAQGDGGVTVRPLGCRNRETASFGLRQGMSETHWEAPSEPGAYELDVFTNFGSNDGRRGDVSGTLGILVDADRDYALLHHPDRFAVCPFGG
jgi:hypothetical protein